MDDEENDQSRAKKSKGIDGRTGVIDDEREARRDRNDHSELYPLASPYSGSIDLVFDDHQRAPSNSRGPISMRNGTSDLFPHTSQAKPNNQRLSSPQQGIEGLTTLASTAADARSPSLRHEPFGGLHGGNPDGVSFRSKGTNPLTTDGDHDKLGNSARSHSETVQSSGLAGGDIFRTTSDQHAALLVGDGSGLEDFSTHMTAPLDSAYAPNNMDMQHLQSTSIDLDAQTDNLMLVPTY